MLSGIGGGIGIGIGMLIFAVAGVGVVGRSDGCFYTRRGTRLPSLLPDRARVTSPRLAARLIV